MSALGLELAEDAGVLRGLAQLALPIDTAARLRRVHGGLSTGRRTAEGIESHRAAVTRHGGRSQATRDFRRQVRELRAEAKRTIELT